jgi:Outer membrane protein beta-barrel domain
MLLTSVSLCPHDTSQEYPKQNHKIISTMKKSLIAILSSAVVTYSTIAQTITPKVGFTMSALGATEFVPEMKSNFSNQTGYSFGVGYSVPLHVAGTSMLSLQPELTYVKKGFKVDAQGEFIFGEQPVTLKVHQEYAINYLEIPVLTKFEFGPAKFRAALYAGPYVAFGLGGRYKSEGWRSTEMGFEKFIDGKGDIKFFQDQDPNTVSFDHNIDFGFQLGVGMTFYKRVVIDVRYGNGLINLKHYSDSKNRVVQFTVGVPINLF